MAHIDSIATDRSTNPLFPFYIQALEEQYIRAVTENNNAEGAKAVLEQVGYTETEIQGLLVRGTMKNTAVSASTLARLTQEAVNAENILKMQQNTHPNDCVCGYCGN